MNMKIEALVDKDTLITGQVEEVTDFSVSPDAMGMFFQAFSDSLYSDKFGSIVREITSNCIDSHIDAGVKDKDVEIELFSQSIFGGEDTELVFRDFGLGLSPNMIKEIYSKYFASTKRNSNDAIGGWGIGAKSPFAYTNIFTVVTWYDNIRYTYVLHRAAAAPQIKLFSQETEIRRNGTEVRIPVKPSDVEKFVSAIEKQLVFFENVSFIGFGAYPKIGNNYSIIEGTHFIASFDANKKSRINKVQISLGRVNYPIDVDLLKTAIYNKKDTLSKHLSITEVFDFINFSEIALKFSVGDLPVTLSREAIEYKPGVIDKIIEKIMLVIEELYQLIITLPNEFDSFKEYIERLNNKNVIYLQNGFELIVQRIAAKYFKPVFKPFKDTPITIPSSPFFEYSLYKKIEKDGQMVHIEYLPKKYYTTHYPRRFTNKYIQITSLIYDKQFEGAVFRYRNAPLGKKHNVYLYQCESGNKVPPLLLTYTKWDYADIASEIGVAHISDYLKWVELYRNTMLKEVITNTKQYADFTPTEAFRNAYKAANNKVRVASENEFSYKVLYGTRDYNVEPYTYTMKSAKSIQAFLSGKAENTLVIYGTAEEQHLLAQSYNIVATTIDNRQFMVIKVSRANYRNLQELPQFVSASDFLTLRNHYMVLAALVSKIIRLLDDFSEVIKLLDQHGGLALKLDLRLLEMFVRTYKKSNYFLDEIKYVEEEKLNKLVLVNGEQVWIYEIYKKVKNVIDQGILLHYLGPTVLDISNWNLVKSHVYSELTPKTRLYAFYQQT